MRKLFFELIQVSTGRLDCLDRGPSPEEWLQLYELSKQQQVEGICYHGVEHLFNFGLRAPQDVSIDWMAETEVIRERNGQLKRPLRVVQYYPEELRPLRQSENDDLSVNGILKIQKVYELFLQRKLNMRLLMDYYFVLRKMAGENETFRGGGLLGMIGVRRFAKGVMWLLQETMGLEREQMPWKPLEKEGRFLMAELMQENSRWQHLLHRITYLFFFH